MPFRGWAVTCAALAVSAVSLLAGAASAATIDDGSWTLDDVAGPGDFTVTIVADTSTIRSGGGEISNAGTATIVSGSTSVTFSAEALENTASPGYMSFAQLMPCVAVEALEKFDFRDVRSGSCAWVDYRHSFHRLGHVFHLGVLADADLITALSFKATGGVPEARRGR